MDWKRMSLGLLVAALVASDAHAFFEGLVENVGANVAGRLVDMAVKKKDEKSGQSRPTEDESGIPNGGSAGAFEGWRRSASLSQWPSSDCIATRTANRDDFADRFNGVIPEKAAAGTVLVSAEGRIQVVKAEELDSFLKAIEGLRLEVEVCISAPMKGFCARNMGCAWSVPENPESQDTQAVLVSRQEIVDLAAAMAKEPMFWPDLKGGMRTISDQSSTSMLEYYAQSRTRCPRLSPIQRRKLRHWHLQEAQFWKKDKASRRFSGKLLGRWRAVDNANAFYEFRKDGYLTRDLGEGVEKIRYCAYDLDEKTTNIHLPFDLPPYMTGDLMPVRWKGKDEFESGILEGRFKRAD